MEHTFLDMPNKMLPGTWALVLGIVAIIVGAIGWMIFRFWRATHIPWNVLPGYYNGAKWFSTKPIDPKFITAALQAAEGFLIARTKWTAANLAFVGHAVHVYVMNTESWLDIAGQKVAGQQVNNALIVGPSLAALCHEMAHLCEQVLDNEIDYAHATWAVDGIAAANADFDAWLAQHSAADRVASGVAGILPFKQAVVCRHAERP